VALFLRTSPRKGAGQCRGNPYRPHPNSDDYLLRPFRAGRVYCTATQAKAWARFPRPFRPKPAPKSDRLPGLLGPGKRPPSGPALKARWILRTAQAREIAVRDCAESGRFTGIARSNKATISAAPSALLAFISHSLSQAAQAPAVRDGPPYLLRFAPFHCSIAKLIPRTTFWKLALDSTGAGPNQSCAFAA
jgi:hypothetical protein